MKECGVTYFENNARIVGGVEAVAHSWPSVVRIKQRWSGNFTIKELNETIWDGDFFTCGGTLIDRETIVTAAHCIVFYGTHEINNTEYHYEIPDVEKTLTVFIGMHDINSYAGAFVTDVRKVIVVSFYCFFIINNNTIKKLYISMRISSVEHIIMISQY